jgi:transposase
MPSAGAAAVGRVLEISGQGEELLLILFPNLGGLRVERVEDTGDAVVIRARCREAQARCPACGAVSSRVHGGYARVVADGAAGGRPVLIVLSVRRFRCPDPSCPKATFAEQARPPGNPSAAGANSAMSGAISAASACAAREHAPRNAWWASEVPGPQGAGRSR